MRCKNKAMLAKAPVHLRESGVFFIQQAIEKRLTEKQQ
jgi:hypothetical protein